jgi:hypothetical protein
MVWSDWLEEDQYWSKDVVEVILIKIFGSKGNSCVEDHKDRQTEVLQIPIQKNYFWKVIKINNSLDLNGTYVHGVERT